MQQRLSAERLRLQLREVEEAHSELDRRGTAKDRKLSETEEREAAAAHAREEAAERAERQTEAKRERQERRRGNIQEAKRQAIDDWRFRTLASDVKASMLKDIEIELSMLPTEDLPIAELVEIARGIRDRHYRTVEKQQNEERERQAQRQRLIRYGCDYASQELRQVEGLRVLERFSIDARVRRELEGIEGDETEDEIEDWIEDILYDEGIQHEDD